MTIFDPDLFAGDVLHGGLRAVVTLLLTKLFQRRVLHEQQPYKSVRTRARRRRRRSTRR